MGRGNLCEHAGTVSGIIPQKRNFLPEIRLKATFLAMSRHISEKTLEEWFSVLRNHFKEIDKGKWMRGEEKGGGGPC